MYYYDAQRAAKRDFKKLKELRKPRDGRRKPRTAGQQMSHDLMVKQTQFNLALHRNRMVSPFDYEYPRLNQMSKRAQGLYDRHLKSRIDKYEDMLRREEDAECEEAAIQLSLKKEHLQATV
jgi:hypothetical protein